MSINARSLRSTKQRDEFECYVLDTDFDVIMVQETRWDSTMDSNILSIPGYIIAARCDRSPDNSGGGCAIFTKEYVMYNSVFDKCVNFETQICGIKIKDLYLVCIYRRPHLIDTVDKQALKYLRKILANKKIFMCGDLNLRDFDWSLQVIVGNSDQSNSQQDTRDAAWTDFMIEYDLQQSITEVTHNDGGLLDVVITNMDYDILVTEPEVNLDIFGEFTDHYAIVSELYIVLEHRSKIRTVFDESKMPWNEVRSLFSSLNMNVTIDDVIHGNEKWLMIRDSLIEIRAELCPTKKVGFSVKSPWINPYLRNLLRKERRMRRSACNTNVLHRKRKRNKEAWIRRRNFVRSQIKTARYKYERNVICKLDTDKNAVHKYFKATRSSNESPIIVDENGQNLVSDVDKCNRFQDHFMAVYNNYDKIDTKWRDDAQFTNIELSDTKIKKVIKNMRSGTAPGFDMISSTYYKELINELAVPLLSLFDRVINHGEFPVDWQISKVSPLFKGSGLKSDVKRWRPLSLGCVGLRILERLFEADFRPYLEENGLLPSFQHGFRSRRSCTTNLVSSWNMLAYKVDKGYSPNVLNLDGTAAFDCLKIPVILEKLQVSGVGGKAGKFIQTWLTERYQFVQLNQATSYLSRVKSGVPQGSVLGPIMYILASSPGLVKVIEDTNNECANLGLQNRVRILTYADDIKCTFYLRDLDDKKAVDILLKNLEDYSKATGLKFNGSKSQLLRLSTNNLECELELSQCKIPEVKLMKDLGCWFNKGYTFIPMMNTQISKAKSVIYRIKNDLKVRDTRSLTQLFHSYYQSSLLYASEVWMNTENATIQKLNDIDDKFWSLLPENATRPDCLSSAQMAIKKNLMLYFKSKFNLAKISLDHGFEFMNDESHTRSSVRKDFLAPKCQKAFTQKEFVYVTTKLLNRMDPAKRESKLISVFAREAELMARTYY